MSMEVQAKVAIKKNVSMTVGANPSMSLIQQSQSGIGINNNNNNGNNNNSTGDYILRRGIISSELGQPEELKV